MAFTANRVVVNNTTPTCITPVGNEKATSVSVAIQNLGSDAIYVGASDVSNTNYGASVVAGGVLSIDNLSPQDDVYVLSVEATTYVGILIVRR